ncbi:MAG TPA: glycosyltransferase family 2 protein [Gemmatimonadaceae bacterium]|nr:glycosyltransferase family 2 protein [Gemmatimonadaceae bacterium]
MNIAAPVLWSLPWTLPPIVSLLRARRTTSLAAYDVAIGANAPVVSVIVPARNERRNIERCVRSILTASYPAFEVLVIDDHSTDGTGDAARAIAEADGRVRVIEAPPLPAGWFGKQWACASGAGAARGDLLLFTDADTAHAPDLLPRAVNALHARDVDLLSVAGHQEMHSFWERVIQPQMFGLLSLRYGGGEDVSRTRHPENAIANGQFILVRRHAYVAMGGHAIVRDRVAEDLGLAQEFVRAGRRIAMLAAIEQLSTHMYASLRELIGGWRKNIFAGGRNAVLGGAVGRFFYPAMLLGIPLVGLIPVFILIAALFGMLSAAWLIWSAMAVGAMLVFWGAIYRFMGEPVAYALIYPLGFAMLLYIAAGAVRRGRRVEWKDRQYQSR